MNILTRTLTYLIILFSLLLSSCGTWLSQDDKSSSASIADPAEVAKRLERQGHYQESAHEYLRLAAQMRPPTQQGYQLSAVKAFLQANMLAEAKTELARLDVEQSYGLTIPIELVRARIDLTEQRVDDALQRLDQIDPNQLPTPTQLEYQQLHAQVTAAKGNTLKAVRSWIAADKLAKTDPYLLSNNHQQLWRALLSYPQPELEQVQQNQGDVFSGWIALALLMKTTSSEYLGHALNNWRLRFPNHPASQDIVPTLVQQAGQMPAQPKQIALLLPLSGKFGAWAKAIRNGFTTIAQTEDLSNRPHITVHDVNVDNLLETYQQVVAEGAEFVVGPLEKNGLEILASSHPQLPIPTLGLNHLETSTMTGNLYQFSLSPEDEAKAVAIRAWEDGYRTALALVPEGDWGKRLLTAFQTVWEQQGGKVVVEQSYGNDFESATTQLRQETQQGEVIFLIAFPQLARQIVPLLGNQLPIYSTSHIYTGAPDSRLDNVLNGVIFADMPWILSPDAKAKQLQTSLQQSQPDEIRKWSRLHALGVDAYKLLSHLHSLNPLQPLQWQGQTGHLILNHNGKIHRDQLYWAQFVKGIPQLRNQVKLTPQ